ncbi:MAG TPA: hypothetical protein VFO29_00430 [Candidatus Rubrimentiphilum sp.]|nr:hypothetical protein [Candidatus Rubrimentiphilum sp.]
MISSSDFRKLASRIDQLERQAKTLKRLFGFSLVLGFALFAGGVTVAQQRQVSFSGANGTVRLSSAGLVLIDKSGRQRMNLGWNSVKQPGLYYYDTSGTRRMGLYLSDMVKPVMRLYDKSGTVRSEYSENTEGTNMLEFYDSSHVQRVYLGQTTTDEPMVEFFDGSHTLRSYMGWQTSGTYGAFINDSAGTTTWSAP